MGDVTKKGEKNLPPRLPPSRFFFDCVFEGIRGGKQISKVLSGLTMLYLQYVCSFQDWII